MKSLGRINIQEHPNISILTNISANYINQPILGVGPTTSAVILPAHGDPNAQAGAQAYLRWWTGSNPASDCLPL